MQNQDRNGEQFGRYRLVRLLGRGSFADVYLGEDLTSQAQYALKLFGIELTEAEIEDFHNTVSLPMQFPGSPVVELRELGVVGKTPFLAMHYAPGGTLREVMRQHTRPAPEVILPYIKRIAGALQRFHEKKLVYRETWPENILLEGNGEIKLGDCGITAMIWKLRPAFRNALTGRINYMAPEQIQGWVYPGSDQYALGVIVYEWLTGDLPFTGSVPEVREKQRFQPPPPLRDRQPEIAGDIEAVVLKALAKSPDARFASIQEFAAAFENACLSTQDEAASLTNPSSIYDVTPLSQFETLSTTAQNEPPLPAVQSQSPLPVAPPPAMAHMAADMVGNNQEPSSQQAAAIATGSAPKQALSEDETQLMRVKAAGSGLGLIGGIMAGIGYFLPWFTLLTVVAVTASCSGPTTYQNVTVSVSPLTNPSCFGILMLLAAITLVILSIALWRRKSSEKPSMKLAGFHLAASITGLLTIPFQALIMTSSASFGSSYPTIKEYLAGFWFSLIGFVASLLASIVLMSTLIELRALSRKAAITAPARGQQQASAPTSQAHLIPAQLAPMQRQQQALASAGQVHSVANSPARPVANADQSASLMPVLCRRCYLPLAEGRGACPRCGYPREARAEKWLLETIIAELEQLTMQDGAKLQVRHLVRLSQATLYDLQRVALTDENMRIVDLIGFHRKRLVQLNQELAAATLAAPAPPQAAPINLAPQSNTPLPKAGASQQKLPARTAQESNAARPQPAFAASAPPQQVAPAPIPRMRPQPAPRPQPLRQAPSVWSSARNHLASLTDPLASVVVLFTCIALVSMLGFSFNPESNRWLASGLTSLVLIFFFVVMIAARRSSRFHRYAHIYTFCFALTIPLLAFDLEQIWQPVGTSIFLFVSMAFFIAAITYGYLAVSQEFSLFGYASIFALTSADFTFFLPFPDGLQWVPASFLLLAPLGLMIVQRAGSGASSQQSRPLPARPTTSATEPGGQVNAINWRVLEKPVQQAARLYPFIIAAIFLPLATILVLLHIATGSYNYPPIPISLIPALPISISLNYAPAITLSSHQQQFSPLSIELTLLLLLFWLCRSIRANRRSNGHYAVPYLLLLCLLFLVYTLEYVVPAGQAQNLGYALALIAAATFFHGINRSKSRSLEPYLKAGLPLDVLAVMLVSVTPLLVAPSIPADLLNPAQAPSVPPVNPLIILVLVIGACLITSVATSNAAVSSTGVGTISARGSQWHDPRPPARGGPTRDVGSPGRTNARSIVGPPLAGGLGSRSRWPWLLLLSSTLFIWAYGTVALWLDASALVPQSLLLLTLLATTVAVLTRRRFGKSWSYPLDVVAISMAIVTSISARQQGGFFLLFFAALFYIVLFGQKRSVWLFMPFILAISALAGFTSDPVTITLPAGLLLPCAAAVVHRLRPAIRGVYSPTGTTNEQLQVEWEWTWPLALFAAICGILVILPHPPLASEAFSVWFWKSVPVSLELALFALVWYGCAWLAGVEWWLLPTGLFAASALLFSVNTSNFPILVATVPITVLPGLAISRSSRKKVWALPWYGSALLSAVLASIVGFTKPSLLPVTAWLLLGFAVLAVCVSAVANWRPAFRGVWLFPAFTTWSAIASTVQYATQPYSLPDLFHPPAIALLSVALGLAISQFDRRPAPVSVQWRFPFYTAGIAAAILTGLQPLLHSNAQFAIDIPVAGYSLLAFAAQLYLIGLAEQGTDILWFALVGVFSCSSLLFFVAEPATITLILLALLCTAAGVGIRLAQRGRQGQTNQQGQLRKYTLPFYSTALLALILTGITCSLDRADSLHPLIPAILLLSAPIAFLVLMLEQYRAGMWLVAALGIWGIFLLVQTQIDTINIVGVGLAAAIGDTLYYIVKQRGQAAPARIWTWALEQFSWRWPWYAIALTAFVIAGLFPSLALTHITPGFQLYSLVVFALVIYGAGMIQKQFVFLWTAPLFALWSLLIASGLLNASKQPDWLYLLITTLCCVAVAILLSLLFCRPRIGKQAYWQTFLCYPLPFYITALAAALLTGLDGTRFPSIRQDSWIALLIYTVVSYGVLRFEKRHALTILVAGSGIWGLLLALHTPPVNYTAIAAIGVVASIVGLLVSGRRTLAGAKSSNP